MKTIEQKKVPILDMAKGALSEEVAFQLGKVAENLLDPNTDWKKSRKMVITLEFTTDEHREITRVTATTESKLATSKPISTQLAFGADQNGELCAVELSKVGVGQQSFSGDEEPENKIFEIGAARKA
jgi:hypothetical protein